MTVALRSLKERHFGTSDVEIKSNWLRMPEERQRRYLLPYSLTSDELKGFVEEYYDRLLELEFVLLASVVDKVQMAETYATPWETPRVAYDLMLQRAQMEMEGKGFFAVEMDNMGGPTGLQHAQVQDRGSELRKGMAIDRLVGNLRFVDSAHSELVQVADLAAYNVFRQFTEHGEEWETEGPAKRPTYEYFGRLTPKFPSGGSGRIQGHGVVKMPLLRRVPWRVKKKRGQGAP